MKIFWDFTKVSVSNEACLIQKAISCKENRIKELCTNLKQAEELLLRLSEERERLDEKACQLELCRRCRSANSQTDDAQNDEEFCRNLDAIRTVDGMIRNKIDGIKSINEQVKELQEEIDAMKKC
jgi:prefoldin subunit 5